MASEPMAEHTSEWMCRDWWSNAFLSSNQLHKCCITLNSSVKATGWRAEGRSKWGYMDANNFGKRNGGSVCCCNALATDDYSVLYCMYCFLLAWTINLSSLCLCHLHVSPFPGALLSWLFLPPLSWRRCEVRVRFPSQINGLSMTSCTMFIPY